jgi:hypothetical protein
MSSQEQIAANRRNAKKSTGPTSPEDKAVCAGNALQSGIYASSHDVIRGEDPAELEALTAALLLHHQPADPTQLALVDTLIAAEWTQRRLRRVEAELWAWQFECLDQNLTRAEWIDASIQHNSPVGQSYQNALEAFSRLQRRIESTNRMYLRTLKALQDLQKAPWSPPVGDKPEPGKDPQPPASPIGSVPSFNPARAERPSVRHENRESSLEKDRPVLANATAPDTTHE